MGKKCYQYLLENGVYRFVKGFDSQTKAAEEVKVDESTIRYNIDSNRKVKGFIFVNEDTHKTWCIEEFGTEYHPDEVSFKDVNKLIDSIIFGQELKYSNIESSVNNVLIVGDLHAPFERVGYLEFCLSIYKKYKCNKVVFIGDIIDVHYSSFWNTDPDGHSAAEELRLAKSSIAKWYKTFPKAKVCLGNHDNIPVRKAFNGGLSSSWIKSISEVMDTPEWEYADEFIIDDVLYTHGIGRKAAARMQADLTSVVQGHYHSESYVQYSVGRNYKLFAMQVGCGINDKSYAMAYGKHFNKMHINCGVVLENGKLPLLEYMEL